MQKCAGIAKISAKPTGGRGLLLYVYPVQLLHVFMLLPAVSS